MDALEQGSGSVVSLQSVLFKAFGEEQPTTDGSAKPCGRVLLFNDIKHGRRDDVLFRASAVSAESNAISTVDLTEGIVV